MQVYISIIITETGSHFLFYAICDAVDNIEPNILGFISRTVVLSSQGVYILINSEVRGPLTIPSQRTEYRSKLTSIF
jgi:hypothetical protein